MNAPLFLLMDIDDTLIDFCRAEREAIGMTAAHFGIAETDRLASVFHEINDCVWSELERGLLTRAALGKERALRVFDAMGMTERPDPIGFDTYYRTCLSGVYPLFDGAIDFLRRSVGRHTVCLISNATARVQIPRLQGSGILPYVQTVFLSELIGHEKPQREFFEYVADFIPDFDPARAVVIGNSPDADIAGATTMGWKSILFDAHHAIGRQRCTADGYADSYAQVERILDEWIRE